MEKDTRNVTIKTIVDDDDIQENAFWVVKVPNSVSTEEFEKCLDIAKRVPDIHYDEDEVEEFGEELYEIMCDIRDSFGYSGHCIPAFLFAVYGWEYEEPMDYEIRYGSCGLMP